MAEAGSSVARFIQVQGSGEWKGVGGCKGRSRWEARAEA